MNFSETSSSLHQIIAGERTIEHGGALFLFREPSGSLLYERSRREKQHLKDCLDDGFLSKEEEDKELKDRKLWGLPEEEKLKVLTSDLGKVNDEVQSLRFRSATKKRGEMLLEIIGNEIKQLEGQKRTFYFQTAEYQASLRSNQWVLQKNLYDQHKRLIWPTWEDFENEVDIKLIHELILECFYLGVFVDKTIRLIARTEPFRSMWRISCKTSESLFGVSVSAYTKPQRGLCYWSMVYDSVYESVDCPDESVINDDFQLNNWFEHQASKRKANKNNSSSDYSIARSSKINSASEVFVMTETKEDAKEVYNLNDEGGKGTLHRRDKEITEKGAVKEGDLSDVQRELKIQMNALQTKAIKERS